MLEKFKVLSEDNDIRVDRWFKRYKPEITHSLLQKMLRKKDVRINGKRAQASYRVKTGDEIGLNIRDFKEAEPGDWNAEKKPAKISDKDIEDFKKLVIYEDKDVLIINKPHGLASQGGSGVKISVDDIIRKISDRYKLVHRLDKDTSGVMVIAKKTSIAAKLGEALQQKKIQKIYWALVKGRPEYAKGKINLPLLKKGDNTEKVQVDENGKQAITEYQIMEKLGSKMSWLELVPITGRTHQLRVHCAEIGCPIIGDGKYGGKEVFDDGLSNKLHLHAKRIIIPDMEIDVTADLPAHMQEVAPNE